MASSVSRFLEAHPFVRLVCPLMAGIAVADAGDGFCRIPYIYVVLILVWTVGLLFVVHRTDTKDRRVSFGALSFLFFFELGFALCSHQWREVQVIWPEGKQLCVGHLTEVVTPKDKSILCPLRITSLRQADTCRAMDAHVLLYLPKDSAVSMLKPGQTICFYGEVKPPSNFTPEFDYVRYLSHHKVTGSLYTRHWKMLDDSPQGWKTRALHLREKLLSYYQRIGIEGEERAVLSALTLGYKQELGEEVCRLYNISGASHVLALSGLHIGILCAVLASVFALLFPGRRFYLLRRVLAVPLIWLFVFVVGLPVSAVRAALMFSLLIVGSCFTRVGFSLNTLALAAFGMLLYNPFYLFDVGFQMSFSAVASLLLLQPWLEGLLPRSRFAAVRYVWSLTTVSVAAQVGVFPLILFYFSRVSPYALLVNLWVVPLTFVIVSLSVPLMLLSFFPWPVLQAVFAWMVTHVIALMNGGLALFSRLPGADVEGISLSVGEVGCLYAFLFFLFYGLMRRNRRVIVWMLAALCLGLVCRLFA